MSTLPIGRLRTLPRLVLEALRAELGPRFVNEQQRRFFDSTAPEILYSGAFRAGKRRIGCEKAYWLAKTYPGIPIGIFRKTAASLYASTERTLLVDVAFRAAIARSNAVGRSLRRRRRVVNPHVNFDMSAPDWMGE